MKRNQWIDLLIKIATPVWANAASGTLRANMPVEALPGYEDSRKYFTHLEAIGRSFCGISPWLVCRVEDKEERAKQTEMRKLVLAGLEAVSRDDSPDRLTYHKTQGSDQPIVDAAFLVHGFLRAPELWEALSPEAKAHIIRGLKETKTCWVYYGNWFCFAGLIETFLALHGEEWDMMRVDCMFRKFEEWHFGVGYYGDGPNYASDYYNSYVIQPMLIDIVENIAKVDKVWDSYAVDPAWGSYKERILERALKYAADQERIIHPDGSYPPLGRSLAYRSGAFQLLAQSALQGRLPKSLKPAQVRRALGSVIYKTLGTDASYDENGWLRIGIVGHQPEIGEGYISTGSLYLCLAGFLPLGLPAGDPFWSDPDAPTTQEKIFGQLPGHAI